MWGMNLPGLYDGSDVINLDGKAAINELLQKSTLNNNKPDLVVAYHPQCPHCHTMVQDFKKLAQLVKAKNAPVNIVAVNMSKTMTKDLEIDGFPTVRFYKGANKYDDCEQRRNLEGFKKFLAAEGITL